LQQPAEILIEVCESEGTSTDFPRIPNIQKCKHAGWLVVLF